VVQQQPGHHGGGSGCVGGIEGLASQVAGGTSATGVELQGKEEVEGEGQERQVSVTPTCRS
jgi:hypothetical protein